MGLISEFLKKVTDVSYQSNILKEANLTQEEFDETIAQAKKKIMLKQNERIVYHDFSKYMEPRSVREYVSGRSGIRLTKGVWIGGSKGRAESHYELRIVDYGVLTITNQRLLFIGKVKSHSLRLNQISAVNPYADAIELAKEGRQHPMYFSAEPGVLLYFAIKDVGSYNKMKRLIDYFNFIGRIPHVLEEMSFSGTFKHTEIIEKCEKIDKVADNLEIEFNNNKLELNSLKKINSDVERVIEYARSLSKTMRSTSNECKKIEEDYMKTKNKKSKSFFGKLSNIVYSDQREIEKIFEENHGLKPSEKIDEEVSSMNDFLKNEFPSDILGASQDIENEFLNPN